MDNANSKMEDSLSAMIAQADALALNAAIMAVTARYKVLYPQWELMAISVHTDPKKRAEDLRCIRELWETHGLC